MLKARAKVSMADFALEMGPETSLLVVSPSKRRFRLERGQVEVRGPCEVTSSFGIVEVHSGGARMVLSATGLEVYNEDGRLSASNALASHDVGAGETIALAYGGSE